MMLASLDYSIVVTIAVFGMLFASAWLLLEWLGGDKPRAEERLDEFKDPTLRRKKGDHPRGGSEAMARALEKATPALAKPLQPKTEKEAGKLKERLTHAGFRSENAATAFLGLKFTCLLAGFVFGGGGILFFGPNANTLLRCGLVVCGMFFVPDVLLYLIASNRKQALFLGLPDALDLLVVCVEAGLALDQAMRKVAEEMKKSYRVIAEEFALTNLQLQMGRPRGEALQDLGQRTGVEDLRSLASILIQADKFGSSIAQALRVQSESMRTRRRQIAEEKAAKTAVKLIFPLVLFIFPGIFVVLVGPAAISMYREMFAVMGG
jgi:tight adherence protein C